MIPSIMILISEGIPCAKHGDELYFDINEIRQKYEDIKFPPDKIKMLPIGGIIVNTIRAEDIEEMTEFDKLVVQFMKTKK